MSTSTGSEPRLRESRRSKSERFFVVSLRLNLYQGKLELLGSVSDTIEHKISAPPDDLRRNDFFRFFDLIVWQLFRGATRLSFGTELRR